MNAAENQCFLVTFKKGLGTPIKVYAPSFDMAKNEGLAYYRKNTGWDEMVDMYSTVDNVIESVKPIED